MKVIHKTRVVSKNFIHDIINKFRNILGLRLKSYEKMIEIAEDEILKEVQDNKIEFKWFRFEITQLTNGAVAINFYGEVK
jgi:uncharacterized protein YbjQ (UPF0145 family)